MKSTARKGTRWPIRWSSCWPISERSTRRVPSSRAFDRLYDDPEWGHMFAVLHKRLNEHFTDINGRAETTRHYWADNSRDLLSLIQEIETDLHTLKRAGVEVELADAYQDALERCRPWLSPSGGSAVPEDFEPIEVIAYEPVFTHAAKSVKLKKHQEPIELKMVGSGSYAHVYSYVDPDYGIKFAVKRAKKDLDERDLERFKQEFEVLKKLSFPYVVEVYRYDEARNEYRMEYCDTTLRDYIAQEERHDLLRRAEAHRAPVPLRHQLSAPPEAAPPRHQPAEHPAEGLRRRRGAGQALGLRPGEGPGERVHPDPDRDEGNGPRPHARQLQGLRGR